MLYVGSNEIEIITLYKLTELWTIILDSQMYVILKNLFKLMFWN